MYDFNQDDQDYSVAFDAVESNQLFYRDAAVKNLNGSVEETTLFIFEETAPANYSEVQQEAHYHAILELVTEAYSDSIA